MYTVQCTVYMHVITKSTNTLKRVNFTIDFNIVYTEHIELPEHTYIHIFIVSSSQVSTRIN